MDEKTKNQKIVKISLISILLIILSASTFLFINALKKEYLNYTEINTIFNDVTKTDPDGDVLIRIETEDGIFIIDNIISNNALYNEINATFSNGDNITIYYYGSNNVLGIEKGTYTVLEVNYSLNLLEKNNQASMVTFPLLFIASLGGLLYTIYHKETEEKRIKPEATLEFDNTKGKKIIKPKIPVSLLIIHSLIILCSFLFIPFLLKIRLLFVDAVFGIIFLYNIYGFIGLFIRKIEINEIDQEVIFFTPFRKKVKIVDIEYINTFVKRENEGPDRYFVEFKIKNKSRLIKFETTSNEQSDAIKSEFDIKQNRYNNVDML